MGKRRGRRSIPQDPTTIKNVRLNEVFLRPLPSDMNIESLRKFVTNSGFLFKDVRLFAGNGGNKSAFIKFHCDSDASKALHYFQNVVLDGITLRTRYTVDYFEDDKEPRDKNNEQISKIRQAFAWVDKHCKTQDHARLPRELADITPLHYKAPRQLGHLMQSSDKHPECKVFDQVFRARVDRAKPAQVTVPEREVQFCDLAAKIRLLQNPPEPVQLCSRVYSIADSIKPKDQRPPPPKRGIGRGAIRQRLAGLPALTPLNTSSTSSVGPAPAKHDDMSSNSSGIFSDIDCSDSESVKQSDNAPWAVSKPGRGRGRGVLLLASQGKMLGEL